MKHLSKDDGLPSNTIYDIYRDSKGFLWIGSDKGIVMYNGISFQTFTTSDGLPDNEIFFFQEDAYGRIWLATYNGELCYYKNDTFHTAANTPFLKLSHKGPFIKYINPGPEKSVVIGFQDQSFFLDIDGDHIFCIDLAEIRKRTDPEIWRSPIRNIEKQSNGLYKVYRIEGIFTIGRDGQIKSVDETRQYNHSDSWAKAFIYTFCQNKHFFFNQNYVYDSLFQQLKKIDFALAPRMLNRIFQFSDKLYMTISDKGLVVNDTNQYLLTDSVVFLKEKKTASISNDELGNVWIGTLGDGIYIMPGWLNDYRRFPNAYHGFAHYSRRVSGHVAFVSANNTVSIIRKDGIQTTFSYPVNLPGLNRPMKPGYLLNDNGDFFAFYKNKFLRVSHVFDQKPKLKAYSNKNMVDGFDGVFLVKDKLIIEEASRFGYSDISRLMPEHDIGNVVHRFMNDLSERIYSVCQKYDGSVWCVSQNGVYKYENDKFSKVDSLSHISFKQILWHGDHLVGYTHTNKLLVYSFGGQNTVDTIPAFNCIWDKIYELDSNHVLVATNKQYRIIELGKGKRPVVAIVMNDFLPHECESICADSEFCYFFKSGNITGIRISRLLEANSKVRLLYESLSASGRNFGEDSIISVTYHEGRNISLYFSTLSYSEKTVSYQYAVARNGGDASEWHNFNSSPLSLINTNYGSYVVWVRAVTPTGAYSTPLVYRLNILYPYWLSWWFIGICVLLLLLILWFVIRRRTTYLIDRRLKEHESEVRYMKSEYKALNALMNPHFIFNALNNVQGLVNSGDKRSANEYLRIFADLVRQNMHNVSMELIPMAKELELVRNYLLLEKLRFDNKLQYNIDIEGDIDTTELLIPPLVIQPLVENAIKHGILPLQTDDGEVCIHVFERDDYYTVEIWDNGVGFSASLEKDKVHKSFGLENLRKRIEYLKQINSMEMELTIEERKRGDEERKWTVVSVSFK